VTGNENSGDNGSGYKRTPATTRFKKGQSGNPAGRPRGRYKEAPFEAVLGQMVTIREDGVERTVTAAEAFMLQLAKRGLEGDMMAARATMTAIEGAKSLQITDTSIPSEIHVDYVYPGSVNSALEPLRMAKKLDRFRETVRMVLEPWLVEAALARLGDRRLTPTEQQTVVKATRTPRKVNWPNWWEVGP